MKKNSHLIIFPRTGAVPHSENMFSRGLVLEMKCHTDISKPKFKS